MDVLKAIEVLETISLKTEGEQDRALKLRVIKVIDEQIALPVLRNSSEFHRVLSFAVHALMRMLQDTDMNVWSLSEQALVKLIKVLNRSYHEWIVYEVWKGMKGIKLEGRSRRFAIELFSLQAHRIQPAKAEQFRSSLLKTLVNICSEHSDQLLQEALSKFIEPILQYQLCSAPLVEMATLLDELTSNVSSPHGRVRRSAAQCLNLLVRHHRQHSELVRATMERMYHLTLMSANRTKQQREAAAAAQAADPNAVPTPNIASAAPPPSSSAAFGIDTIVTASPLASTYVLQGVLHCFRQLLRVTQEFVPRDKYSIADPMLPYLVTVTDIAMECLKHDDNNVIVAALELLQEIIKSYWVQLGYLSSLDSRVDELLLRWDAMIFGGRKVRVSVQVLVVSCACQLALHFPAAMRGHVREHLHGYLELLKHTDPLLRGQAYYFIGCLISGYLDARGRATVAGIDSWTLDIFSLLWTVLNSIMTDDSAIAAKMACEALALATDRLLASEYAFFVPVALQHVMCLPRDAYLLLKSKVMSLVGKVDFRVVQYLEESVRDFKNRQRNGDADVAAVHVPEQLTMGQQSLQAEIVDFVISFLEDSDHRVRHKAGKILVRLVPQLAYAHYFDTLQKKKSAVCLRLLDLQTSQHLSAAANNSFKEPTDWLLWRMIGKMNQSVDSLFIKGYYHFLRQLLEAGFSMPGQLVTLILDQLACSNLATDVETQLDILVMMSYLTKFLTSVDSTTYLIRIFVHLLRILNILTSVIQGRPIPPFKESKSNKEPSNEPNPQAANLDANGEPLGSVQSQPQYLQLWEKLQDVYRVSLTSLNPNLFDDMCHHTIRALERVITALGRLVLPFLDELLAALPDHFEREADGVIGCLTALVAASMAQLDPLANNITPGSPATNARGVTFMPEKPDPAAGSDPESAGASASGSIFNLTIPSYGYLLPSSFPGGGMPASPIKSPMSPRAAALKSSAVPTDPAAPLPPRRRVPRAFEPMLTLCMEKYDKIQSVPLRRSILKMLTTLAMMEGDYAQVDKELHFLRNLHQFVLKCQNNYKDATDSQHKQNTSDLPTRVAASLYFTDILGPQLAFLYEVHLRLSLNLAGTFTLNTVDLALLLPLAFEVSWRAPDSDVAFSAMANVLFLPNLEARQKRKRAEMLQKQSSAPGFKRPSGSAMLGSEDQSGQLEESRIEAATLRDMRREFLNQLLALLPDARAVNLLKQIVALLRAFPEDIKSTIFFEFARLIAARIQQLLIESHLLVKNSVAELLSIGELIDELPREVFVPETMVASLFDAALARPLPEPKPQTYVLHQELMASRGGGSTQQAGASAKQQNFAASEAKRPENVERKMIASQNRWWLPRVIVLLRILVKFDEQSLLDATKRINATVLFGGRAQAPDAAFASALFLLIERTAAEMSRGVPDEELERWSRLSAMLIHFVAYFIDKNMRKSSSLHQALKAVFAGAFNPAAATTTSPGEAASTLAPTVERLREVLRGMVSSYLASCGFMICKLFDVLQIEELPRMLLDILMSTDAASIAAIKWSWHLEVFKSVVCVTLARVSVRLASPAPPSHDPVEIHKAGGLLFDDAVPTAVSLDTTLSPMQPSTIMCDLLLKEDEPNSTSFLDLLTRQINDPDVKQLITTMARQPKLHARICSYVERLMSHDVKLEMLSPQRVHELFLLLTYIPPTIDSLRLLFEYFTTNGHISVQIACEHFLWTLMSSDLFVDNDLASKRKTRMFNTNQAPSVDLLLMDMDEHTTATPAIGVAAPPASLHQLALIDDVGLKKLVEQYRSSLRPSFARKLRKMHWLQLVSLSQTDLPSFGPDMSASMSSSDSVASPVSSLIDTASTPTPISPIALATANLESPATPEHSPRRIPSAIPTTVMRNTVRMETGVQIIRGSSLEPKSFLKYFENRDNSYYLKIIQTLTAVMPVSKDLFVQILRSSHMQPYFLSFCLQNSNVDNVKNEVLTYLNDELRKWIQENPVVSGALEHMIITENMPISTENTFEAPSRSDSATSGSQTPHTPSELEESSVSSSSGILSPLPMSPVRGGSSSTLSTPFSPGDLRPPSMMADSSSALNLMEASGLHSSSDFLAPPTPGIAAGDSPANLRLLDSSSPEPVPSVLDMEIPSSPSSVHGVDVDAEQRQKYEDERAKIRGKFRSASVETEGTLTGGWRSTLELAGVIAMVLHRFGKDWPKQKGWQQSTNDSSLLMDSMIPELILPFLDAGALLAFATTTTERLLFLHERKLSVLATFDFVVVLSMLRQMFAVFPFTSDAFKRLDNAKRLLYYMYELYFVLFKPDKKEILDYSSFDQVDPVFNFFWKFLRDRPWMRSMEGSSSLSNWNRAQERFIQMIQTLAQSSSSLEISVYPIQRDPINFDYNDDPVRVLEHFILLINSMPPQFPNTLNPIWDCLYCGIDPKEDVPAVATSTMIKARNLRALVMLAQRVATKALLGNGIYKLATIDDFGFPTFDSSLFNLDRLRKLGAAASAGQYMWHGSDLLALFGQLFDPVIKPAIEQYAKSQTSELNLQIEAIRSVVVLSDFYFTQDSQWQWMLDTFTGILEASQDPWMEDPLAKQYILLGCCKAAAVLAPVLEKSPANTSSADKTFQCAKRLQQWLRYCVNNMKLRENEIHEEKKGAMPIPTTMLMYSIHYLLETRSRLAELIFKADDDVSKWIHFAAGDFRQSAFARNVAKLCSARLHSLGGASKGSGNEPASDIEPDIKFIEEVKNLFIKIRKSPLVHVERLAKTTIPAKLIQSFNPDQMLSMLIGELARPEPGVQNIALILYHTLSRLKEIKKGATFGSAAASPVTSPSLERSPTGPSSSKPSSGSVAVPVFLQSLSAADIDATVTRWIIMCLESFVQLSSIPNKLEHAQWALAALFLAASPNPLQRILFFDLIAEQDLHVDERVFVLAGVDFYCNQNMDVKAKAEMVSSISKMKGSAFAHLSSALQPLLEEDRLMENTRANTMISPPGSPMSAQLSTLSLDQATPSSSAASTAPVARPLTFSNIKDAMVATRSPLQVLKSVIATGSTPSTPTGSSGGSKPDTTPGAKPKKD